MPYHFLTRLASILIVIFGVVTLVFLFIHLVPGDPIQVMLGEMATPADQTALREALGLDRPLIWQWLHYIGQLLQGDLGHSLYYKQPISELIAQRFPVTFQLACVSLLLAVCLAFPLGCVAAVWKDSRWDYAAMFIALIGISIPNFVLSSLLILIFSLGLGWFPVSGWDAPNAIVLPAITLGTALAAILARMIRATLLEVLQEEFIRTAYAKGASTLQVILHHALHNAALPILTLLGLQLGTLLAGAVITETIFSIHGIGSLTIEAIKRRDYPVVQACVLLISLSYVLINLMTESLYALLDPRIRQRS